MLQSMTDNRALLLKALDEIQSLKQSVEKLIASRSDEDKSPSGIQTPTVAATRKRQRDASDTSATASDSSDNRTPCRIDLSPWTRLFQQEALMQQVDVEDRLTEKKQSRSYVYGNYPHYYNYRLTERGINDPRLQLFCREWFNGRDCLDVGSHEGVVPLGIVIEFAPKSMKGIEIDSELCEKAERLRKEQLEMYSSGRRSAIPRSLKRTRFILGDFMQTEEPTEAYDIVTCLSISKWLHLHHGDAGMKTAFRKFWTILRPSGYLIFEPQSLRSYERAMKKIGRAHVPYPLEDLRFFPEQFLLFLSDVIGFEFVRDLRQKQLTKGFEERSIYLLRKPSNSYRPCAKQP